MHACLPFRLHTPLKTAWAQLHWGPADPTPQEARHPQSSGMQGPSWPQVPPLLGSQSNDRCHIEEARLRPLGAMEAEALAAPCAGTPSFLFPVFRVQARLGVYDGLCKAPPLEFRKEPESCMKSPPPGLLPLWPQLCGPILSCLNLSSATPHNLPRPSPPSPCAMFWPVTTRNPAETGLWSSSPQCAPALW